MRVPPSWWAPGAPGPNGARIVPPDAASPPDHDTVRAFEGAFFLLPAAHCEIVDSWFVYRLSGTGSKDIVVRDAFLPAHRVLLFSDMRAGTTPGGRYHPNPIYRMPCDARRLDAGLGRGRRHQRRARSLISR